MHELLGRRSYRNCDLVPHQMEHAISYIRLAEQVNENMNSNNYAMILLAGSANNVSWRLFTVNFKLRKLHFIPLTESQGLTGLTAGNTEKCL